MSIWIFFRYWSVSVWNLQEEFCNNKLDPKLRSNHWRNTDMLLCYKLKHLGLVSWEKVVSRCRRPVYRDIIECSQAGDGPATPLPLPQRHNKTTRILALMTAVSVGWFSCRCFECLSRAAGTAAGESISFHLIAELQTYIVSCHRLF